MKLKNLLVIATAMSASSWAITAQAVPSYIAPEIVLTENSSTSLTATVDGSDLNVYNVAADEWFVYGFGAFLVNGSAQWAEPDASGEVNSVASGLDSTWGLGLLVYSDAAAGNSPVLADGTKDTEDFSYLGSDRLPVNVTFNDLGDSSGSTVPDSTTTMPLLGAAVTAMFGLARRVRK